MTRSPASNFDRYRLPIMHTEIAPDYLSDLPCFGLKTACSVACSASG